MSDAKLPCLFLWSGFLSINMGIVVPTVVLVMALISPPPTFPGTLSGPRLAMASCGPIVEATVLVEL